MNFSNIFRVVNMVAAAFMIIGGVMTCIHGGFPNFIQGIFVILFGLMTVLFEFRMPGPVVKHASFMFSFMGRGLFYIFLGFITVNYGALSIASGVIVIAIGLAYVALEFTKIEPPNNMRKEAYDDAVGQGTHGNASLPTFVYPTSYEQTTPYEQSSSYAQPESQPATVNVASSK
ncbi:hypothetical protein BCV72DRAFT_261132 [Rhizopus microsporus var. microsporus]|uniref:COPI associated n=2 Tax=Rhizopus microsporus TaxID=58291 RepID=A0A2G4SRG1_RHIZD|nr:uncharacterized protein RHIMIDRAFT_292916 [Rhizopus microsporus ATCC 52813]ORE08886.1 hypothetical protein BCV72DRAFT_261132 [Rhizopus microsporus var. microsporus]PHZ11351.1 hypothetical protein RHIMIDRAFT_292916 [Rhizopus microsporus ATCC 52813]